MQHGLLFHSLTEEGEGVYLGQLSFLLEGGVDADAFAEAWQRLADRTPMLRTAFARVDTDQPLQVVREHVTVPVERLDWRALPESEREQRLAAFLAEDRTRGIDLAVAPLMRLALIDEPDGALRVVWTSHHLLLDGWSSAELVSEVVDDYLRLTGHDRPGRPPAARSATTSPGSASRTWARPSATGGSCWTASPPRPPCPPTGPARRRPARAARRPASSSWSRRSPRASPRSPGATGSPPTPSPRAPGR